MPSSKKTSRPSSGKVPSAALLRIGEKIEKLKTMTTTATEFSVPMNFFMDELASDSDFLGFGKLSKDKKALSVFKSVCKATYQQINPQDAQPAFNVLAVSLDQFKFFHGGGSIGNQNLMLIYFQDLDVGITALSSMANSRVVFSRFTAKQFTPSAKATWVNNPSNSMH
jgi:hypothetical protein